MLRRAGLVVVGIALILDGLAGWSTDVVAVVAGLILVGAVSVDGVATLMGRQAPHDRPSASPR
jgi:hypothetical protein